MRFSPSRSSTFRTCSCKSRYFRPHSALACPSRCRGDCADVRNPLQILEKEREIAEGEAAKQRRPSDLPEAAPSSPPAVAAPEAAPGKAQSASPARVTVDLALLSVDGVARWLDELFSAPGVEPRVARHREEVVRVFRDNEVAGADLSALTVADMRDELLVASLAVRKFLLRAIADASGAGTAGKEQ